MMNIITEPNNLFNTGATAEEITIALGNTIFAWDCMNTESKKMEQVRTLMEHPKTLVHGELDEMYWNKFGYDDEYSDQECEIESCIYEYLYSIMGEIAKMPRCEVKPHENLYDVIQKQYGFMSDGIKNKFVYGGVLLNSVKQFFFNHGLIFSSPDENTINFLFGHAINWTLNAHDILLGKILCIDSVYIYEEKVYQYIKEDGWTDDYKFPLYRKQFVANMNELLADGIEFYITPDSFHGIYLEYIKSEMLPHSFCVKWYEDNVDDIMLTTIGNEKYWMHKDDGSRISNEYGTILEVIDSFLVE